MSGFGRTSAPVAICGVLGFLEALNSYNFDFHEDAAVVKRSFLIHGFITWLRPDI
jgi:hypothetical protein